MSRGHFDYRYYNIDPLSEQNAEIQYSDCADALLKLWMENIITDGEYNRIMDRLNKAHKDGVI